MTEQFVVFWVNPTTKQKDASYPVDTLDKAMDIVESYRGFENDFMVDSIVRFDTYSEANEAFHAVDHNLWVQKTEALPVSMLDKHPVQKAERGWSDREIFGYGLDATLLQELAEILKNIDEGDAQKASYGMSLLSAAAEDAAYELPFEESRKVLEANEILASAGILWLGNNIDKVYDKLLTPEGRNIIAVIGDAMMAFGTPDLHSWPGRDEYENYEDWIRDCHACGVNLTSNDFQKMKESLEWLSKWHGHIWE